MAALQVALLVRATTFCRSRSGGPLARQLQRCFAKPRHHVPQLQPLYGYKEWYGQLGRRASAPSVYGSMALCSRVPRHIKGVITVVANRGFQ